MANQYHDETGRFCSKNEMGDALNRLAQSGRMTEYIKLRDEYDSIEKAKGDEVRDTLMQAVQNATHSTDTTADLAGLISEASSSEALTALYNSQGYQFEDDKLAYLRNPHTPEDIRVDILEGETDFSYAPEYFSLNLSERETEAILSKLNWTGYRTRYGSNTYDFRENLVGFMRNSNLSKEQLKHAVASTNMLHVWEAYHEAGGSWDEKDEESIYNAEQVEGYAMDYEYGDSEGAYETVLRTTKNRNLLAKAISDVSAVPDGEPLDYRFNARSSIAGNPNLTPELATSLLETYRVKMEFMDSSMRELKLNYNLPEKYRTLLTKGLPVGKKGEPTAEETEALWAAQSRRAPYTSSDTHPEAAYEAAQARVDAYNKNYRDLVKRLGAIQSGKAWDPAGEPELKDRIRNADRMRALENTILKAKWFKSAN